MRSCFRTVMALSAVAFLLCLGLSASALMVEYDLDRLVEESESAIIGEVVAKEYYREPEGRQWIYTFVTVKVDRSLYGKVAEGSEVVVRITGGKIMLEDGTGIGMGQSDTAVLEKGEKVFLFLEDSGGAEFRKIAGKYQGKFSVIVDPESGRAMVRSAAKELVHPESMKVRDVPAYVVPLEDLVAKVKQIAAEKGR